MGGESGKPVRVRKSKRRRPAGCALGDRHVERVNDMNRRQNLRVIDFRRPEQAVISILLLVSLPIASQICFGQAAFIILLSSLLAYGQDTLAAKSQRAKS